MSANRTKGRWVVYERRNGEFIRLSRLFTTRTKMPRAIYLTPVLKMSRGGWWVRSRTGEARTIKLTSIAAGLRKVAVDMEILAARDGDLDFSDELVLPFIVNALGQWTGWGQRTTVCVVGSISMTFEGAVVKDQGFTFALVIVKESVLLVPSRAQEFIANFSPVFPGLPVILMAQDFKGVPTYYGRPDIAKFVAGIPLNAIPWKKFSLN